ncbi:Rrf2 family transcriptional regulator [Sphingobium sufflavum]|uniref:Rrf2 family transcriptional regulator n=1 Tax=Sphingobium sufflavum TaxID=1129547 RepID=UPI001F1B04D7|nr:Rrf2 family transcriptional regulator [Sphingobium sufflavum]MCE7797527.1 Rrf2 family transcriptional regulator [Sphingobium sufflavum]
MRLTRYTDYALRILLHTATAPDGRTSIAAIAERHAISKNHVMKVVNQLANDGFLKTVRGRGGGLQLARPAEDIRIGEVVRRTEPELQAADCGACMIRAGCGLTPILGDAMRAFIETLDRVTLAEAVRRCEPGLFPLFGELG